MKLKFLFSILLCLSILTSHAQKHSSEDYVKITNNGSWCWFSDPRAIYADGQYYGGYVDSTGNIWSFSYNPINQEIKNFLQFEKLDKDDHANPSIARLKDGRFITFFSGHGGMGKTPLYYRITKNKNDISSWGELQQVGTRDKKLFNTCYSNPAILSAENYRTYLFYRGADFRFKMCYSDDLNVWSEEKTMVKSVRTDYAVRPYVKVSNNGKDRIHIAFTDGHPRNETLNSIHYICYRNGQFETASGKKICNIEEIPFTPDQSDLVYDAGKNGQRSWIWDVTQDENDKPVLVYARFFSELKHEYWYARWDGTQWINKKITDAGRWFPLREIPREGWEGEPHYSGGVYLDHSNPNIVYLSRPINNVFEIQKWETADMGKTWKTTDITSGSTLDNVRPFVPINDPNSRVLWMYNYHYPSFIDFYTAIRINDISKGFSGDMNKTDVKDIMQAVGDWQIKDLNKAWKNGTSPHSPVSWVNGALYLGIFDWASLTGNESAFKWLNKIGNENYWQVGPRMYHADDICIAQLYLKMYEKYQKQQMLTPTIARADWVISNLKTEDMKTKERWNWCDALFMAPAVYANLYTITKDEKYLKFMDQEFKATYDFLYDKNEKLFFRDASYFDKKEANGRKVFWGRGNGWVMGGLVNILKVLPKNNPYRPFYENLFKEMSDKIAELQGKDGFWHASLLDPDSYPAPETSSSGFMVYALAYGINEGLLNKNTYMPVVEKGWKALVSSVNTEGKLGWVQPIGQDPKKVTKDMTELYGVGAFLSAGAEIEKLAR